MDLSQAPDLSRPRWRCSTAQISDVRDRLNGRVWRQGDDPAELRIEFDRLLAEQKALQARRPIDMGIIESCKAWLAALPTATLLEQVNPGVEDGLSLSPPCGHASRS
jgi:hypothetical protein